MKEKERLKTFEGELKTKLNQAKSDLQQKCFEIEKIKKINGDTLGEVQYLKDKLSQIDQTHKSREEMLSNEIKHLTERIDEG